MEAISARINSEFAGLFFLLLVSDGRCESFFNFTNLVYDSGGPPSHFCSVFLCAGCSFLGCGRFIAQRCLKLLVV